MPPHDRVVALNRVDLVHSAEPHPFHLANRERAAENWRSELGARPMLFDGAVMLADGASVADGVLSATCHLVPYSTFLLWRKLRPVEGTLHVFAMALPVGSDGGVLVARMAGHTANAGLVYCPCGSFDRLDIAGGRFDADANMAREVAEETGLDLGDAEAAPGYGLLETEDGLAVVVRAFRFAEETADLARRAERHIAAQSEPELAGARAVMAGDGIGPDFTPHMAPILAWHFSGGTSAEAHVRPKT